MGSLFQDLRYGLRGFASRPAFTAVAIFTLAIGIGANTAIFSVANALLLQPLAFAQPDRLAFITSARKLDGLVQGPPSFPRFELVRDHNRSFSAVTALTNDVFNLTGRGNPEQLAAARVSWNFFDILGIHPAIGRSFTVDEDKPGGQPVVLIADGLWRRRFAADPEAVGRPITLDSKDYTVIGVLPANFRFDFFGSVDIVAPRVFDLNLLTPQQLTGGAMFLSYVARLRPSVGIQQAQAEMDTMAAQYRNEHPKFPDADPGLIVHAGVLRDELVSGVRPALLILFGAVGLVLLIACANVASLLLSRALGRQREIAVRTAIGATRANLIRQLLTESLMLALAGGLLGAALSAWGTRVLSAMAQNNLPRAGEIHSDAYVLAFTIVVSLLAGVLFGLAPALQISRPNLSSALRAEGRGATAGRHRNMLRNLLVVAQVALSVILLIGAGLLIRNFLQLRNAEPGFDSHDLLTMKIALPPARYSRSAQTTFYNELARQVREVPGVQSAAVSSALPMNPSRFSPALPEGQPMVPIAQRPVFNIQMLSTEYAETMRIPILRGREFTARDGERDPLVAMVNESLVRVYWRKDNPIGKHILLGLLPQPLEVVGVLNDVRNRSLAADVKPEIYLPFAQRPWPAMNLVVRAASDPHNLVNAVRARIFAMDRDQPVTGIQTMDDVLEAAASQPRFTTSLLGGLSATALLLAIVGIYGVIACSVTERTQEMGIRIALGAGRADILGLVLRQGLTLALTGIAIGLSASLALTRLLDSLLYRVSVTDPVTYVSGAAIFIVVALLASYLPARRATEVDPIVTLR